MKKTKKKTLIIAIISVVIILALGVSAFFIIKSINNKEEQADSNGVVGKISADWDTGLDKSKKSTESSSSGTQIPGYGTAEMKAGDTQLHLSIGNPKENNCGFYATLQLEDGTVLYKSELLKPGYGLTEVPLPQHGCIRLRLPLSHFRNSKTSGFHLLPIHNDQSGRSFHCFSDLLQERGQKK